MLDTIAHNVVFRDHPCKNINSFSHQYIYNKTTDVSTLQDIVDTIANALMFE